MSKIIKYKMFNNFFVLLLCLFFGFQIAYLNRFDYNWDFLNYHFYNSWAFLNDRLNYDVVPSSVNTFFNPLLDLPLFFLIEHFNDFPSFIYGIQGLWFGILLFVFIKLSRLLFYQNTKQDYAKILLAAVLASTGQATFFQIGSCTNEIPLAALSITVFYFLTKWLLNPELQTVKKFLLIGIFFGIGLGMKPTVITYCIASGLSLIILHRRLSHPVLFIFVYFCGGVFGYLISNGYFMIRYWDLYQNPFFPFLNGIFKSEWFDDFNYSDARFRPTAENFLYYPFLWFKNPQVISEIFYYDYRFPVFYLFLLLMSFKAKVLKHVDTRWQMYWAFMLSGFVVWYFLFCILRYAVVLEMLMVIPFSAITVEIFTKLNDKKIIPVILKCSFFGILCGIFLMTPRISVPWDRSFGNRYVNIEVPAELPEKFLLKLYGFPTAGIIPVWAQEHTFRALGYRHLNAILMKGSDFVERRQFRAMRDEIEQQNTDPVIIVHRVPLGKNGEKILQGVDLSGFTCRFLENNFDTLLNVCLPKETEKFK